MFCVGLYNGELRDSQHQKAFGDSIPHKICVHVFLKKFSSTFLNFPSNQLACLQVGSQEDIYIRTRSREKYVSGASLAPILRIENAGSSQSSVRRSVCLSLYTHVTIREKIEHFLVIFLYWRSLRKPVGPFRFSFGLDSLYAALEETYLNFWRHQERYSQNIYPRLTEAPNKQLNNKLGNASKSNTSGDSALFLSLGVTSVKTLPQKR